MHRVLAKNTEANTSVLLATSWQALIEYLLSTGEDWTLKELPSLAVIWLNHLEKFEKEAR